MTRDDVDEAISDLRMAALEAIGDSIADLHEKGVLDEEDVHEVIDLIAEGDFVQMRMYIVTRQQQYREHQPSLLERLWPFA